MKKQIFEIHRSTAIDVLLAHEANPLIHTNLKMGDLLEEYYPTKDRGYLVKEDYLELKEPSIKNFKTF